MILVGAVARGILKCFSIDSVRQFGGGSGLGVTGGGRLAMKCSSIVGLAYAVNRIFDCVLIARQFTQLLNAFDCRWWAVILVLVRAEEGTT